MKVSIDSGNSLLQGPVSNKQSSPDDEIKTSKRRKSCKVLQKANAMSSDEDENDASEEANTQRQHDTSEADALSLFGGDDIYEIDDTVIEVMKDGGSDNAILLSAISSFLSFSLFTGHRSANCKWPCSVSYYMGNLMQSILWRREREYSRNTGNIRCQVIARMCLVSFSLPRRHRKNDL